jgi:hypothetical protein
MSRQTAWDLLLLTIRSSNATPDEKIAILTALQDYIFEMIPGINKIN